MEIVEPLRQPDYVGVGLTQALDGVEGIGEPAVRRLVGLLVGFLVRLAGFGYRLRRFGPRWLARAASAFRVEV